MRIFTLPGVFRPRSDTWMLAALVASDPALPGARALDLCTGSGAIAITAARMGASSVTAVDVSRRAVLTTRLNARACRARVDARRGDLFRAVGGRRFDLIVSNPPYLPSASDGLPTAGARRAWEGGRGGRAVIDRIIAEAPSHLTPGGALWLVHSSVCGEGATVEAAERAGLRAKIAERRDGPLGPLLSARLHLLDPGTDREELVAIRATRGSFRRDRAGYTESF